MTPDKPAPCPDGTASQQAGDLTLDVGEIDFTDDLSGMIFISREPPDKTPSLKEGDHCVIVYSGTDSRISIRAVRYQGPDRWWFDYGRNEERPFLTEGILLWGKVKKEEVDRAVAKFYYKNGEPRYYKVAG